ncbi:MAG: UDP-N-acetylglucosamine 2-epimerase (non-hydrolyzing) [Flavobacteriales bacterium]|nr:MAG: UDP-N-acetylglucosamine 2-epimerase (non-hydrolyzing) [Flavobacteriales bacterium]
MKKIVTVIGARPQVIKAAVLSNLIKKYGEIEEILLHTGQHFDANMSAVFFEEMQIPEPKYNLNIKGLSHGAMTGRMLEKIEAVLHKEKPDGVVVYGDTNSTIAGALAAKKYHIKVIHIEAGLRSFKMNMPEEINRILTDRISDLLLCPTKTALQNLNIEGFKNFPVRIVKCGDIMKDAVNFYSSISDNKSKIVKANGLKKNEFVLATIHRQENTDNLNNLTNIFKGLDAIHKRCHVIVPVHPRTQKNIKDYRISHQFTAIAPVGYLDMLQLLKNCKMVITDSGGLQKEAYFNEKHCIIARKETEWVELVENGFAKITGSSTKKMIKAYEAFNTKISDFSMNLYGNNVGEKIYKEIKNLI